MVFLFFNYARFIRKSTLKLTTVQGRRIYSSTTYCNSHLPRALTDQKLQPMFDKTSAPA